MLNPNKLGLDYSKPKKHRDAKIIYNFCEGDVREFDYFNFFSQRLKDASSKSLTLLSFCFVEYIIFRESFLRQFLFHWIIRK